MPGPKDIHTAYKAFRPQHPRPSPREHEAPKDGNTTGEEPSPSAESWTPPAFLPLAPKEPQTCYPHCPATPYPLAHPQAERPGDK